MQIPHPSLKSQPTAKSQPAAKHSLCLIYPGTHFIRGGRGYQAQTKAVTLPGRARFSSVSQGTLSGEAHLEFGHAAGHLGEVLIILAVPFNFCIIKFSQKHIVWAVLS